MSLKKYEAFVRTVELGSLTKAAQSLGSTQSRISHILNDLEEEYGFRLMRRSRGGIELTEAGQLLLPKMRAIVEKEQELSECVGEIRSADAGTVRVGVFTSVAVHWLPGMIRAFQAAHPRAQLEMRSGDYHDVEQWLREGSVNLGFITLPGPDGMKTIPLAEDPLVAILPKGHRLASLPQIPIEELGQDPFISLLQSSAHDIHRALDNAGIRPNIKYTTKDDYAILAMVEQGLGISIVPQLLIRGRTQNLEVRPLIPRASRTIALAIPGGEALPVVRIFAETAVDWLKKADSVTRSETQT
ncbi:MAG: LysR substrate-binding domain-containing protein [Eubacteriales bacterium]|nr:LysR substrate-binding domain-containing protein [Eubacteriales bacterium]